MHQNELLNTQDTNMETGESDFTEADLWQELDGYFQRKDIRQPGDIDVHQYKERAEKIIGHRISKETARTKMLEFAKDNNNWKYMDVYNETEHRMCKVLRKVK